MTDSQLLDKALDFIVQREEANDHICEVLHNVPEEFKICGEDCQNLNRNCVLRFLKYYEQDNSAKAE